MFLFLIVITILVIYYVSIRKFNYWKIRNVPFIKPTPFLGNYGEIFLQHKNYAEGVQGICKKLPDEKFIGAFYGTEPVLIPMDPDIIKLIVTKDFYYFNGRELSEHMYKEPAALNLFSTHGDNWRVLRQNMTLLFSSAKMRNMFHLIQKCSYVFETMLDRETSVSKELETRSVAARYTIECIGACVFGIDANTMTEEIQDNPFNRIAALTSPTKYAAFIRAVRGVWPSIFYGLGYKLMSVQMNFFHNLITSVMNQRNYKPSGRNDFLDLILSWKQKHQIVGESIENMKNGEGHKVSLEADDDLLVAQCFLFFNAGFETSATILSYTLYELAKNEDIQKRVLQEVDEYMARHENKLCYECVSEFPYLWAAIGEAQRLYPVLGVIFRETMEDYTLPGGVVLEKGMRVHIPVYYLHKNPKYFPNPEEFRPERFLGDEKYSINPYTYMPFGEGPRTCMGKSKTC
ncbi:hypothetical protein PYW08_002488 [Mythimna loreyi]|uniref:Uncharacterized protein n=1 Tax=Mythimna loreyi TaxID=667449 RepID=A0ACC2QIK8_9NEOP|nr:hypothetical protein PYW08_002488 [Mythimna loreyi]